jgi:PPP family 3-phenylpropionic acid transporter
MKNPMTLSYTAVQGTYWMYFSVIIAFSSVFLLSKGYTNSEIGVVLAVSNILSVIIQPILADVIDRSQKVSLSSVARLVSGVLIVGTLSLVFFETKSFLLSTVFVLLCTLHISIQPMINAMAFHYRNGNEPLNFGVARSGGSIAFSFISALLGFLVVVFGTTAIPVAGVAILILLILALTTTERLHQSMSSFKGLESITFKPGLEASSITLISFIRRNGYFVVFSISVMLIFFQNSVINNYMIQIIAAVGGRSDQMGRLLSFMALLELPGLFFFRRIRFYFSCQTMLKISAVAFVGKVLFTYLATSVGFIYIAFLFQLISFPFFLSASVHLVDEVMERGEAVKGQSMLTGMMTLSAVFGSLIGGVVLDVSGPSILLFYSTIVTVIGALILFLFVDKVKVKKVK